MFSVPEELSVFQLAHLVGGRGHKRGSLSMRKGQGIGPARLMVSFTLLSFLRTLLLLFAFGVLGVKDRVGTSSRRKEIDRRIYSTDLVVALFIGNPNERGDSKVIAGSFGGAWSGISMGRKR